MCDCMSRCVLHCIGMHVGTRGFCSVICCWFFAFTCLSMCHDIFLLSYLMQAKPSTSFRSRVLLLLSSVELSACNEPDHVHTGLLIINMNTISRHEPSHKPNMFSDYSIRRLLLGCIPLSPSTAWARRSVLSFALSAAERCLSSLSFSFFATSFSFLTTLLPPPPPALESVSKTKASKLHATEVLR